jgi:hypothetical protein
VAGVNRLDQLRRLAEAATPGPWTNGFDDGSGRVGEIGTGYGGTIAAPELGPLEVVIGGGYLAGVEREIDAAYIALGRHPQAIRKLIEDVERILRAGERLADFFVEHKGGGLLDIRWDEARRALLGEEDE